MHNQLATVLMWLSGDYFSDRFQPCPPLCELIFAGRFLLKTIYINDRRVLYLNGSNQMDAAIELSHLGSQHHRDQVDASESFNERVLIYLRRCI